MKNVLFTLVLAAALAGCAAKDAAAKAVDAAKK